MRTIKGLMLTALVLVTALACNKTPEFIELESGLKYRKLSEGSDKRAGEGDIMNVVMTHTLGDSVLYDSGNDPGYFLDPATSLPPNLSEVFQLCGPGDSVQIEMAFTEYAGLTGYPVMPEDSTKVIVWNIKVNDVGTEAAFIEKFQAKQRETDRGIIEDYLVNNNLEATTTDEGIAVVTLEAGNGEFPQKGDKVKVDYSVRLLDGTLIDTSDEELAKANDLYYEQREYAPYEFTLGNREVIEGWDLGIPKVDKGGKAKLLIPSQYAYGARNDGGPIPPNSVLVFDIEVVDF
ncbi:MAG: FKBP-type peptidyl-prolyl cis-trans isomerase [Cytophagia bacterium]|nr:FKBP-type peptidyl-prolyl cis-trans isomerase [Cytophagia bacterium]